MIGVNKITRSTVKRLHAEFPIGDPFGGAAYGKREDPATVIGGASIVGGLFGSSSAKKAAKTQAAAADRATALQQHMFDTSQANLRPYMNAGEGAASRLSDMLGTSDNTGASGYGSLTSPFTADTFRQYLDPSYQFQLQQGNMALQNSQAAQDGVLSGAALKDLIGYNQGMANTAYNNAFNQYQTQTGNIYQRLSGLATLGQNAAAGAGTMATQAGANMADTITGAGNAQAAGIMGTNNAVQGGLNNISQLLMLGKILPGGI